MQDFVLCPAAPARRSGWLQGGGEERRGAPSRAGTSASCAPGRTHRMPCDPVEQTFLKNDWVTVLLEP